MQREQTFFLYTDWRDPARPVKTLIFICPRVKVLVFWIEMPVFWPGFCPCFTIMKRWFSVLQHLRLQATRSPIAILEWPVALWSASCLIQQRWFSTQDWMEISAGDESSLSKNKWIILLLHTIRSQLDSRRSTQWKIKACVKTTRCTSVLQLRKKKNMLPRQWDYRVVWSNKLFSFVRN